MSKKFRPLSFSNRNRPLKRLWRYLGFVPYAVHWSMQNFLMLFRSIKHHLSTVDFKGQNYLPRILWLNYGGNHDHSVQTQASSETCLMLAKLVCRGLCLGRKDPSRFRSISRGAYYHRIKTLESKIPTAYANQDEQTKRHVCVQWRVRQEVSTVFFKGKVLNNCCPFRPR